MGEWIEILVGNNAEVLPGFAFDSSNFADKSKGIPLIRIRDLKKGDTEVNFIGKFSDKYLIQKGDILIGMDGDFHVARWAGIKALLNQRVCKVTAKGNLDNNLLYYFLIGELLKIQNQTTGTTVKHLSTSDVSEIKIKVPKTLREQNSISKVLNSVDQSIEKTEQLIAKYERIKTGLMQDLLTRGIDEEGNIRSEETHAFKDSALGRIPVEWEVVTVFSLCKEIVVGIVIQPTQYYKKEGFPLLRSFNIKEGKITRENLVFISAKDNDKLSKSKLKKGDVVSVRTGYPGTTAVVNQAFESSNCIDLVISRTKSELDPYFLSFWINSEIGKKQIASQQKGVAQQHFNVGEMKEMLIVKVPLREQKDIVTRLNTIELVIEELLGELEKLKITKKGLMQDLLTGKVRVDALMQKEKTPQTI